jgi:hypothetical protein
MAMSGHGRPSRLRDSRNGETQIADDFLHITKSTASGQNRTIGVTWAFRYHRFHVILQSILDFRSADDRTGDQTLSSQHRAVPGDTPMTLAVHGRKCSRRPRRGAPFFVVSP